MTKIDHYKMPYFRRSESESEARSGLASMSIGGRSSIFDSSMST